MIDAHGQLRHRFWGDYSAVIALEFRDAESARDALQFLGAPWRQAETLPAALVWSGDSDALAALKQRLAPFIKPIPCNRFDCHGKNKLHPIDGLEHSTDYGAPFRIELEATPAEQSALFGEG